MIHYFFANNWPIKIWTITVPALLIAVVAGTCWPTLITPTTWTDPLIFFGCVLLAALLGWFLSILLGWPVIGPLYYDRSLKNGEPFHKGDTVHILAGPHRDRIVPVIEAFDMAAYAGGHRVRVDLGEAGQEVFSSPQVLRIASASPEVEKERKPNQAVEATADPLSR